MKRLFALAIVLCAVALGLPADGGACTACPPGSCLAGELCPEGDPCYVPRGQCCGACRA